MSIRFTHACDIVYVLYTLFDRHWCDVSEQSIIPKGQALIKLPKTVESSSCIIWPAGEELPNGYSHKPVNNQVG